MFSVWGIREHKVLTNFSGSFQFSFTRTNAELISVFPLDATGPTSVIPSPLAYAPWQHVSWNSNGTLFDLQNNSVASAWASTNLIAAAVRPFDPSQATPTGPYLWWNVDQSGYVAGEMIETLYDQWTNSGSTAYYSSPGSSAVVTNNLAVLAGKKYAHFWGQSSFQTWNGSALQTNTFFTWLKSDFPQVIKQPFSMFLIATLSTNVVFDVNDATNAANQVEVFCANKTLGQYELYAGTDGLLWDGRAGQSNFLVMEFYLNGSNSYIKTNGVLAATGNAGTNGSAGLAWNTDRFHSLPLPSAPANFAQLLVFTNSVALANSAASTNLNNWLIGWCTGRN
jgi:hypothetical protein